MAEFMGLIMVIAVVALIIFYKGAIKKTGQYVDDVVTVNINESQVDLIKRSQTAYERLVEECGEDYMTAQQIYDKMMRTPKRVATTKKK